MSLGRRRNPVDPVPAAMLRASPRGPFYERLARALQAERFDEWLEDLVRPFYAQRRGRPSVAPGVYFRMLLIASIEGIVSQRELAWRCADSLSLRTFLGVSPSDATPDHSTLTLARRRLPPDLVARAMSFVWAAARRHDVLRGRSFALGRGLLPGVASDVLPTTPLGPTGT